MEPDEIHQPCRQRPRFYMNHICHLRQIVQLGYVPLRNAPPLPHRWFLVIPCKWWNRILPAIPRHHYRYMLGYDFHLQPLAYGLRHQRRDCYVLCDRQCQNCTEANLLSQRIWAAPNLLVLTYTRGLLSVKTVNLEPSKESLNFSHTDHLSAMSSILAEL